MDYTTWTRADWLAFDNARSKCFAPTTEEIEAQKKKAEEDRINAIQNELTSLGIDRPEHITKEWALWFLTMIDAKVFIGDDLSWWLDSQEILFWTLDNAFDDLILRYL